MIKDIKVTNPYLDLGESFYNFESISPLKSPYFIDSNGALAKELGLDDLSANNWIDLLNGKELFNGSKPFAMVYAGHQFGHFVPRLGDGRAINIGTINGYHLQLKGSGGVTKYSRSGDGRAVLRSSIREYLISEHMSALGIESTRAVAIIGAKHRVFRQDWESGAIVLRASKSWVRFGTFEYFANKGMFKEVQALADYVIKESYPHLIDEKDRYFYMFLEVVGKSAKLVAKWMAVGFNHGVLNTDNCSIAGLSLDYGPFAFLDDYDINYICNHTDHTGRYSFGNQPSIMKWNLMALASALSSLIDEAKLKEALKFYDSIYLKETMHLMRQKLGLDNRLKEDTELISHLLGVMQSLQIDYTLFFRELSNYKGDKKPLLKLGLYETPLKEWLELYDKRLMQNSISENERLERMKKVNPKYILKNWILQEAIDSAKDGNFEFVKELLNIAQNPYDEHPKFEKYAKATPSKFKNRKLSCSS